MPERRPIDEKVRQEKLAALTDEWGASIEQLTNASGSVFPGICSSEGCTYTTEYEPDQDRGWCDECEKPTVVSVLVLLGVI